MRASKHAKFSGWTPASRECGYCGQAVEIEHEFCSQACSSKARYRLAFMQGLAVGWVVGLALGILWFAL